MIKESPELQGPEFDTGENYETDENRQEIFQRWLTQLSPRMKQGEDLKPEYKQPIREYLMARWDFDPYKSEPGVEDEIDIRTPTAEELEGDWNG
jgi:hypothetical protein